MNFALRFLESVSLYNAFCNAINCVAEIRPKCYNKVRGDSMKERETNNLEYKLDITNTFLKTITAFSNYGGGQVIFGLDDDGKIVGLDDLNEKALNIENKVNDSISPLPDYNLKIDEEKKIIRLLVREGIHKPYYYKGKTYKRADSSTLEVDRVELNRLILEGSNKNFEDLTAFNQDLSFSYLEEELREKLNIKEINLDILKTLGLYSNEYGYNKAGEILSDKNSYEMIDLAKFGDTMDIFISRDRLGQISLVEAFNKALKIFRDNYTYEIIEGASRKRIETIPEKAFREALANGIVHRSWDVNSSVRVAMFEDKIEIISPGGLPLGISKEEYLNGQISLLRNPILAGVFFRLNIIEQFGTGIMRINQVYKDSLVKPTYDIFQNSIRVTLPVYTDYINFLGKDEELVFNILKDKGQVSRAEVEELSGFSKAKSIRLLNNLIDENLIEKVGMSVDTKYRLL